MLEDRQGIHDSYITTMANVSASNDNHQQRHDANEFLIRGAEIANAAGIMDMDDDEALHFQNRKAKRRSSESKRRKREELAEYRRMRRGNSDNWVQERREELGESFSPELDGFDTVANEALDEFSEDEIGLQKQTGVPGDFYDQDVFNRKMEDERDWFFPERDEDRRLNQMADPRDRMIAEQIRKKKEALGRQRRGKPGAPTPEYLAYLERSGEFYEPRKREAAANTIMRSVGMNIERAAAKADLTPEQMSELAPILEIMTTIGGDKDKSAMIELSRQKQLAAEAADYDRRYARGQLTEDEVRDIVIANRRKIAAGNSGYSVNPLVVDGNEFVPATPYDNSDIVARRFRGLGSDGTGETITIKGSSNNFDITPTQMVGGRKSSTVRRHPGVGQLEEDSISYNPNDISYFSQRVKENDAIAKYVANRDVMLARHRQARADNLSQAIIDRDLQKQLTEFYDINYRPQWPEHLQSLNAVEDPASVTRSPLRIENARQAVPSEVLMASREGVYPSSYVDAETGRPIELATEVNSSTTHQQLNSPLPQPTTPMGRSIVEFIASNQPDYFQGTAQLPNTDIGAVMAELRRRADTKFGILNKDGELSRRAGNIHDVKSLNAFAQEAISRAAGGRMKLGGFDPEKKKFVVSEEPGITELLNKMNYTPVEQRMLAAALYQGELAAREKTYTVDDFGTRTYRGPDKRLKGKVFSNLESGYHKDEARVGKVSPNAKLGQPHAAKLGKRDADISGSKDVELKAKYGVDEITVQKALRELGQSAKFQEAFPGQTPDPDSVSPYYGVEEGVRETSRLLRMVQGGMTPEDQRVHLEVANRRKKKDSKLSDVEINRRVAKNAEARQRYAEYEKVGETGIPYGEYMDAMDRDLKRAQDIDLVAKPQSYGKLMGGRSFGRDASQPSNIIGADGRILEGDAGGREFIGDFGVGKTPTGEVIPEVRKPMGSSRNIEMPISRNAGPMPPVQIGRSETPSVVRKQSPSLPPSAEQGMPTIRRQQGPAMPVAKDSRTILGELNKFRTDPRFQKHRRTAYGISAAGAGAAVLGTLLGRGQETDEQAYGG